MSPWILGGVVVAAALLWQQSALAAELKKVPEHLRRVRWPLPFGTYRISSRFGPRIHPVTGQPSQHTGVDLAAPADTPVLACAAGIVTRSYLATGYGNRIIIKHAEGITSTYNHMSALLAKEGTKVSAGQRIGLVGSTGTSTGNHLHFEFVVEGSPIDPLLVAVEPASIDVT